jgi:hypothetical protein
MEPSEGRKRSQLGLGTRVLIIGLYRHDNLGGLRVLLSSLLSECLMSIDDLLNFREVPALHIFDGIQNWLRNDFHTAVTAMLGQQRFAKDL